MSSKLSWENAFKKLGSFSEVQSLQLRSFQKYWNIAERDDERFGLKTEAGFSLCFDISVQNGGIHEDEERRIRWLIQESSQSNDQDIGKTIANVVAENSNPKWIEDMLSRKFTVALGKGTADGAKYNVKTWGFDDLPS